MFIGGQTIYYCQQPEPFFVTFAIYDAKEGKKISEDFHVDPNEPEIKVMIPADIMNVYNKNFGNDNKDSHVDINGLKIDWMPTAERQVGFSTLLTLLLGAHTHSSTSACMHKCLYVCECVSMYGCAILPIFLC